MNSDNEMMILRKKYKKTFTHKMRLKQLKCKSSIYIILEEEKIP